MRLLLHAVYDVPDLIRSIFTGKYALAAMLITVVYIVAVLLNNKMTRFLREIIILAASVAGVIAYFKKRYAFLWLMLILLAVLLLVRFLCYMLVTIRIQRRNRRIERRALEKAAQRRGSWKNRRGYSGAPQIDEEPVRMPAMDRREIADVLENETSEREGADIDLTAAAPDPEAAPKPQPSDASASELSRPVVMDAIRKLEELKSLGILTEEEVAVKKSMLYGRMR